MSSWSISAHVNVPSVLDRKLVIVSGKGGVGKSAVAAALALLANRQGRRVLVVSMSGDGGLAAHLTSGPLDYRPTELRPGLHAMAIDRSKALTEYLQVQLGAPSMARFGPLARAFDALASAAPGIREVVTIGKVLWEVRRRTWDLVVADAPPTGQVGSYLRAPRTVRELVPTGRIREQAAWMEQILLTGEVCRLAVVTVPEELPVNETLETLSWLQGEGVVATPEVLANRVLPPLRASAKTVSALPSGPARDAAELHLALRREQERWLEELPPGRSLPYLFGLATPGEVAARLADELEAM
ncbi:MAG: ArsA family ATPase [Acidimicrobiia bacterium]